MGSFLLDLLNLTFARVTKVSGLNLLTYLNWTPVFEGCVVRCVCKNEHQKDVFRSDWTMSLKVY